MFGIKAMLDIWNDNVLSGEVEDSEDNNFFKVSLGFAIITMVADCHCVGKRRVGGTSFEFY